MFTHDPKGVRNVYQGAVHTSGHALGHFNSRDELLDLLDRAAEYGSMSVGLHGVVAGREFSNTLGLLTVRILVHE
jgi:hypothetical protein